MRNEKRSEHQVRNQVKRRGAYLALSAAVVCASSAAWANTELDVPNGTTDLTTLGATNTSDLTFTNVAYSPAAFTAASNLDLGTLNNLDATNALGISGAGVITLNGGSNSVAGGPAATDLLYVAAGGGLSISNPLTLAATASGMTLNVNGNTTLSGAVTSTSGNTFTLTGGGTLAMSTNNLTTNLANFVVASGTLSNNQTSALGGGTLTLGAASGSANATIIDASNVNLTNPVVVAAGSSGTLRLTGGVTAPSFTGTVTLNNNVTLGNGGTSTNGVRLAGIISGTGNVTVDGGNATVTFASNANTFTGTTTILSGNLAVSGNVGAATNTVNLGVNGGTANAALLDGNTTVNNPITVVGGDSGTLRIAGTSNGNTGTLAGALTLNNNLTLGNGGSSTAGVRLTGAITTNSNNITIDGGAAGPLAGFTSGNIVIAGASAGTFTTPVSIVSGNLLFGNSAALGGASATPGSGVTVNLGTATGTANAGFVANGNLNIPDNIVVTAGDSGTLRICGNVAARGPTFTGSVTINNAVTLGAGGTTATDGFGANFSGALSGSGAITVDGGNSTLAGATIPTGFVGLSGNNSAYTGNVTINTGELRINGNNALTANNTVTVNSAAVVTDLNVLQSVTIAGLNSNGTGTTTSTSATTRTLSFGGAGNYTAAGPVTGNLNLAMTGTGYQKLTGSNTYSGNTSVPGGGILQFATTASLPGYNAAGKASASNGILAVNVGGGGEWASTDVDALAANASFTGGKLGFDTTDAGGTFTYSTGGLTMGIAKLGTGTLVVDGASNFTGATVNSGTLVLNRPADGNNNVNNAVTINNGGTLQLGSTSNSDLIHFNAAFNLNTGGTFDMNGHNEEISALNGTGGTVTNTNATAATIRVGGGGNSGTWSGVIQDGAGQVSLIKGLTGTQVLSGVNTYTGNTTVNGGTLTIDAGGALAGSPNVTVASGATLNAIGSLSSTAVVSDNGAVNFGLTDSSAATTQLLSSLTVAANATASITLSHDASVPKTLHPNTLTFNDPSTGKLDITNNVLISTGTVSQAEALVSNLSPNVPAVITSDSNLALGYGDAGSGNYEIRATLLGDSDLDGKVNVADLANLAGNFGKTDGQFWISGDFDYNGNVNVADLADLAGNFGKSLGVGSGGGGGSVATQAVAAAATVGGAAVPEPATIGILSLGALALASRRQRRRT
jgi:autotransporter-associated beta strand protein